MAMFILILYQSIKFMEYCFKILLNYKYVIIVCDQRLTAQMVPTRVKHAKERSVHPKCLLVSTVVALI